MKKIWTQREDSKPPFDLSNRTAKPEELSSGFQLSDFPFFFQKLISSRGIKTDLQIKNILYPDLSTLKDPFTIKNMAVAVDRIIQAYRQDEMICIYTDFDLDGTSGLALLKFGLEGLGFKQLTWMQPKRLAEGYGFHASLVDELHQQNVKLIVTVDVGISSIPAVQRASELGIDVIITDHHLPGPELPKALSVINPNQSGDQSGLGYLCGAGVAFYLLRALKRKFFDAPDLPKTNFDLKEVLEFFAIATITDMVPLIEDNRVLVKHGLIQLQKTKRPALRALMNELDLGGRELTSQDLAMKLAPKINALSRMENEILPRDIYLMEDVKKSQQIVSQVLQNNTDRVQHQAKAEEIAKKYINQLSALEEVSFVYSSEFHRGIVGLVATKLSQLHHRPAFVSSLNPEEETMVGSARLPSSAAGCLVEALSCASAHLIRFGGHSAAAGFELHKSQVENVKRELNKYFKEAALGNKPQSVIYDMEIEAEDLSLDMIRWLDFLGPYGSGFPIPSLKLSAVRRTHFKELRGGHLKLELKNKRGTAIKEVMVFSPSEDVRRLLLDHSEIDLDILFEVQKNTFNGSSKVQLIVKEIRASQVVELEPKPLEISPL